MRSNKNKQQDSETTFTIDTSVGPTKKDTEKANSKNYVPEGVRLEDKQKAYLLPHFTMLVVGKPGSGKTSTIRQMLTSSQFYLHKFDQILIMSPSASKMGVPINKKNMNQQFDLRWIEEKLLEMNKKQVQAVVTRLKELALIDKVDIDRINGKLMDQVKQAAEERKQPLTVATSNMPNLFQEKERFFSTAFQSSFKAANNIAKKSIKPNVKPSNNVPSNAQVDIAQYVDRAYQEYYVKLPVDERQHFQKNCLIIFDDMVSQIKANEFNPLLSQLIFNRRHLLLGGTISVMIVSQKYTMIPARLRSNSNWFVLFRLNPLDFDNVYKDVITMSRDKWDQLIDFTFGGVEKKYNNLGIWVETDEYFLNFQKININQ